MEVLQNLFSQDRMNAHVMLVFNEKSHDITLRTVNEEFPEGQNTKLGNLKKSTLDVMKEIKSERAITEGIKFVQKTVKWGIIRSVRYVRNILWKPFYFDGTEWSGEVASYEDWEKLVKAYGGDNDHNIEVLREAKISNTELGDLPTFTLSASKNKKTTLGEWAHNDNAPIPFP